jgi:hypothetical protein
MNADKTIKKNSSYLRSSAFICGFFGKGLTCPLLPTIMREAGLGC